MAFFHFLVIFIPFKNGQYLDLFITKPSPDSEIRKLHSLHSEKEMATHSSTLAWKIPWTEEPGRLQSMGSLRVRHDWSDLAVAAAFTTLTMWYSLKGKTSLRSSFHTGQRALNSLPGGVGSFSLPRSSCPSALFVTINHTCPGLAQEGGKERKTEKFLHDGLALSGPRCYTATFLLTPSEITASGWGKEFRKSALCSAATGCLGSLGQGPGSSRWFHHCWKPTLYCKAFL